MTLPREAAIELMALADGELDGEARARAESLVASDAEARRFVEATQGAELRTFLENHIDDRAMVGGANSIVDSVMASLHGVEIRGPLSISRRKPPERLRKRSAAMQTRLRVASVAIGVAMAAGVALYVTRRPHATGESVDAKVELAPVSPSGGQESPPGYGVEVDEIDSPTHDISVFEITGPPAAAAAANPSHPSSVVIWVEDGTGPK